MHTPLVEPIAVPEIYIDGIARIEELGANVKLTFFTFQRPVDGSCGALERVIVARFVMPREAMAFAAMQALAVGDTEIFGEAKH